jgi:putative phosphoribosyl transferase
MRFRDRGDAGQQLAPKLEHLRAARPVVLGLTRGGVEVAFEVARALEAPLDLVVVRKLAGAGAPGGVVGAIAEGGIELHVPAARREAGAGAPSAAEADLADLAHRIRLYRAEFPANRLGGRTVVVVDDFVATGFTARAAARAARQRGAARVVLAVPVLSAVAAEDVRRDYDEVVALDVPPPGQATGEAYDRLEQASDEAALGFLRRARLEWRTEALPAGS